MHHQLSFDVPVSGPAGKEFRSFRCAEVIHLANGHTNPESFEAALPVLGVHRVEIFVNRIAVLHGKGLHPLGMISAVSGFDFVNHHITPFQGTVAGTGQGLRMETAPPMVMERQLAPPHDDLADGSTPGFVVLGAGLGHLLYPADRPLHEFRTLRKKRDLLCTLDNSEILQLIGEIHPLHIRKRIRQGAHETMENDAFRCPYVIVKPHDAHPSSGQRNLSQLTHDSSAVGPASLPEIRDPILNMAPPFATGGYRCHLSVQWKHAGDIGVAPSAHMGQITGLRLEMGGMTGIVRRDETVQVFPLHGLAHGGPAPVTLGVTETRLIVELFLAHESRSSWRDSRSKTDDR